MAQPLNATLLLAFVLALFWHAQLGLQVVIEDYVPRAGSRSRCRSASSSPARSARMRRPLLAIGRIVFTA